MFSLFQPLVGKFGKKGSWPLEVGFNHKCTKYWTNNLTRGWDMTCLTELLEAENTNLYLTDKLCFPLIPNWPHSTTTRPPSRAGPIQNEAKKRRNDMHRLEFSTKWHMLLITLELKLFKCFSYPSVVDIHWVWNSFYRVIPSHDINPIARSSADSEGRSDTTPTLLLPAHAAPLLEERLLLWILWNMSAYLTDDSHSLVVYVWCQQLLGKFQYANLTTRNI